LAECRPIVSRSVHASLKVQPLAMNIEQQLQSSLSRWNLLESAFYQAWSAGTLPVDALKTYAHEYGAFISKIADGWQAHGDVAIAAEEREHVEMWREFAKSLGTDIGEPATPAVRELTQVTERRFSESVDSLGALYAFEAQQPATATSKLEGLRKHYDLDASAETYFEVHATDEAEPALLLERIKALPEADQTRAAEACEETARALRLALDGLYDGCTAPTT